MKNGDTVLINTGKNKGQHGVLVRGFTQNKQVFSGATAHIKKVVVRLEIDGKERTYNRWNIKALESEK